MKTNLIKLLTVSAFALAFSAVLFLNVKTNRVMAKDDDPATVYKTKCAACHTPKAEKFYDPAVTIDDQTNIIMKGKKGEKPPYMPSFEAKGMTAEQAKALAEYMKGLRTAPAN